MVWYKVHRYQFGILRFRPLFQPDRGEEIGAAYRTREIEREKNRRRNDLFTLHFQFFLSRFICLRLKARFEKCTNTTHIPNESFRGSIDNESEKKQQKSHKNIRNNIFCPFGSHSFFLLLSRHCGILNRSVHINSRYGIVCREHLCERYS